MKTLKINDNNFYLNLNKYLNKGVISDNDVSKIVRDIIADVRLNGDDALLKYTNKFDRTQFSAADLQVTKKQIDEGYNDCSTELIESLKYAKKRIVAYHEKQLSSGLADDLLYEDEAGVKLGWKWNPVQSAGLYVPGGTAIYPSAVLMNAIPAQVAGVKNMVMVVPTPDNVLNPALLAAAKIVGIDKIYRIGGAQAIASMAYGTSTIPKVNKIVGPGNAYVAEAKRQVFGVVGIDMVAGPSEILVVADGNNDASHIAADLLSQAEHDISSRSILITDDLSLANNVEIAIQQHLQGLSRREIATKSIENNGLIIVVDNIKQAPEIANIIAAEHVEILTENPDDIAQEITEAGAIFLGKYTPEAIGDYIAGPSHVLPTSGSARFSSGLGVYDFLKRTSIISCDKQSFAEIGPQAQLIAQCEGLDAHALSLNIRK